MAEHNDLGKTGEKCAKEFLVSKGYKILETNWKSGKYELDIIAEKDNILVVAEVKTRTGNAFGEPEDAVKQKKKSFTVQAADKYLETKNLEMEVRFDVISILSEGDPLKIRHIEDAFSAWEKN